MSSPCEWSDVVRHSVLQQRCEVFHLPPSATMLRHVVSAFLTAHRLQLLARDVWQNNMALLHVCDEPGCQEVARMIVRRDARTS